MECVPNFSEGRNGKVIEAIADAIRGTEGCSLLDVDSGESTNRTVYTFVGAPSVVVQGALAAARVAFKLIDMAKHKGGWVGVRGAWSPGTLWMVIMITLACRSICNNLGWQELVSGFTCRSQTDQDQLFSSHTHCICTILSIKVIHYT